MFMVLVNPDGYEFARSCMPDTEPASCYSEEYADERRLWRKNRRPAPGGSTCLGVDVNRNFPATFGGAGSEADPCSERFRYNPQRTTNSLLEREAVWRSFGARSGGRSVCAPHQRKLFLFVGMQRFQCSVGA